MSRETTAKNILSQFDASAKAFCEQTNGIFCDITSVYKNEAQKQNLQYRYAKISYNSFVVKFTYTAHGLMSVVHSVLSCCVSFDKSDNPVEIPLPLMTDYCHMDIDAPMCIPLISNKTGMQQAFACIESVLNALLPQIAEISADTQKRTGILAAFENEMLTVFGIAPSAQISQAIIDWSLVRFSTGPFLANLKGNRKKAAKKLRKVKKLTGYEKRMIALWESQKEYDIPDLSAIVVNAEAYSDGGIEKFPYRDLISVLVSMCVLVPVIAAVYLGLYFLLLAVESRGTVYLMGPVYNFPFCIIAAFITAFSAGYFTRFKAYKIIYKKRYAKYCEMSAIQTTVTEDKLMKWFTRLLFAGSIVLCLLLSHWNIRFLPDGFVDNSKFLSYRGQYYAYSQVERVYYKADRVNGLGEVIEFPSYVIVLKDGKEIDLYELGDIEDYDPKLLDQLRAKGVKIDK